MIREAYVALGSIALFALGRNKDLERMVHMSVPRPAPPVVEPPTPKPYRRPRWVALLKRSL